MAKRKTPKVETIRPEKITKEEHDAIKQISSNIQKAHSELGMLEVEKHTLLHMVANMKTKLSEFSKAFNKKYGTDNINILDGSISYDNKSEGPNDDKAN